jgi:hypothetical protein
MDVLNSEWCSEDVKPTLYMVAGAVNANCVWIYDSKLAYAPNSRIYVFYLFIFAIAMVSLQYV